MKTNFTTRTAALELEDHANAEEFFAYGLGRVDHLGTCVRLLFYVPRLCNGLICNDVIATIVVPKDQLCVLAAMLVEPPGNDLTKQASACEVTAENGRLQ
jgi:hypothetical protein